MLSISLLFVVSPSAFLIAQAGWMDVWEQWDGPGQALHALIALHQRGWLAGMALSSQPRQENEYPLPPLTPCLSAHLPACLPAYMDVWVGEWVLGRDALPCIASRIMTIFCRPIYVKRREPGREFVRVQGWCTSWLVGVTALLSRQDVASAH